MSDRIIADIAAQQSRLERARRPKQIINNYKTEVPYWKCKFYNPGVSVLAALGTSDWSAAFLTSATDYLEFDIATATGSFNYCDQAIGGVTLHDISWSADAPYTVRCMICEDGVSAAGDVQVQFNGVFTNYAISSAVFELQVKKGVNRLVVIRDYEPDGIQFIGRLWDNKLSRWVNSSEF